MIFEPNGARGVLLQEKEPSNDLYAESFKLNLYGQTRFKVNSACRSNLHQRNKGKSG